MRGKRMSQRNTEEVMAKNFTKWLKPTDSIILQTPRRKKQKESTPKLSLLNSEKQRQRQETKRKP